jgi:hypothetical protein
MRSHMWVLVVCGGWIMACGPGTAAAQTDTVVRAGAGTAVAEAEAGPTIAPEEAAAHKGRQCTVEMTIRSARHLDDKEICLLNSSKQHRDADNFTVVIFKAGLARLTEAGIAAPADHYLNRTIRVRGVVQLRNEKPQIVVESPDQIELVEETAARN